MVVSTQLQREVLQLTPEAEGYAAAGTPEYQLWLAVPEAGITEPDLKAAVGEAVFKIGKNTCMKNQWLQFDKASKLYTRKEALVADVVGEQLRQIRDTGAESVDPALIKDLKKRQLVDLGTQTYFSIQKGPKFSVVLEEEATDVTKAMLADGSWKTAKFKPVNLRSLGADIGGGHLHLLMKMRAEYRKILLEMGFSEMPTNRFVESSFWNFDSLFQPQSHPARDAHDTFFVSYPTPPLQVPEDYLQRVKTMHETGGSGSIGYRYDWKREEAQKYILRTHTTAVSARMLYQIANQPGGFKPIKLFSIDRVFRNETLDATHLAEFHQVEGVVADYGLGLGDLIGVITEFFSRVGIKDIKLKSAYNPYTEPSMEIFSNHPVLGLKEIGNSGVFRPEMLAPMGLPPGVRVIAWGLSLERPTMITYGFNNIRDLFGHKVKLTMSKHAPIVRLDKK